MHVWFSAWKYTDSYRKEGDKINQLLKMASHVLFFFPQLNLSHYLFCSDCANHGMNEFYNKGKKICMWQGTQSSTVPAVWQGKLYTARQEL